MNEIERYFKSLFNRSAYLPSEEIEEKENKVHIKIQIPQLTEDHKIRLSLKQNHLTIHTELKRQKKINSDDGRYMEESYSEYFHRTIPLPAKVTSKGAAALYDQGILTVSLNKVNDTP